LNEGGDAALKWCCSLADLSRHQALVRAVTDIFETRPRRIFAHAYTVTILNRRALFSSRICAAIHRSAWAIWPQTVIFEVTFIVLGSLNALGCALLAWRATSDS
jgi:hypothetical protein